MMQSWGLSIYSLPLVVSIIMFLLLAHKNKNTIMKWLPGIGFLVSALLLVINSNISLGLAAIFTIYSALQLLQTHKSYAFSNGSLVQVLFLLQGVFAVETLISDSIFKMFAGLSSVLMIQMFRNYLATDDKRATTVELASYWLVLIVMWWALLFHNDFSFQQLIAKDSPRSMVLFLLTISMIQVFFQYIPWRGFKNIAELNWLNSGLLFHMLLQAKLFFISDFFQPQLFAGSYVLNSVRWLYFLLPLVVFLMILKNTDSLRRYAISNYFSAVLITLFYSSNPSGNDHVLFVGIIFIAICMLLQNYAFDRGTTGLDLRENLSSRVLLIVSLFVPLFPLSGALRVFFPAVYEGLFKWEEYSTLFYFPTILTLVLMILALMNALILCNDKLLLKHQDVWVLRKSDITIAFILLPFIFLGIYPSPLYNYIQKYFIFP